jgi:hypothetical protein
MRTLACLLGLMGIMVTAVPALAAPETEERKTISLLAVNTTPLAAVAVTPAGPSVNCGFGIVAFNPTTPIGRAMLATLISAQASKSPVTLVYDRVGNGCTLTQVTKF